MITESAMNDTTAVEKRQQASREVERPDQRGSRDESLIPPVDVIEDSGGITLRADLPGVPKDKLGLHVESDSLTIEGDMSVAAPEGMQASYAEVSVPRFRRVFTLSKELNSGRISAELNNGVLTLRIPKADHAQPRRIPVNAG